MKPTTSQENVWRFICAVNYYCNMWERCLYTSVTLTNITSKKIKFKWTKIKQDSFDENKRIVDHDTLLAYPDFNEVFKIHTDDSKF